MTHGKDGEAKYLRWLAAAFVLASCVRAWIGPELTIPRAAAQIPDSGLQRNILIEEARRTNQLLTELKDLLRKETINVRIAAEVPQTVQPQTPARGGK